MDRDGLADFLRRRRAALQPSDVGLPAGRRRRTAGLRREEVATLAAMSTDFYTRLEQRRGSRPSAPATLALARALRLTVDEREHLLRLAGHTPPPRAVRSGEASPTLVRVLEQLRAPAQVVTDLGVTLRQNELAVALLGDETAFTGPRRSLIWRWFAEPDGRALFRADDHLALSRSHVATLRAIHGRAGGRDPEARELVDGLLAESAEFAALWERHEVAFKPMRRKRYLHPDAGEMTLVCEVLTADDVTQILVVFSAEPGADEAELVALLRAAEAA